MASVLRLAAVGGLLPPGETISYIQNIFYGHNSNNYVIADTPCRNRSIPGSVSDDELEPGGGEL